MKVRMMTTSAGPSGGWNAGQVLDREDGADLVKAGLAVPYRPRAAIERATGGPQRQAEDLAAYTVPQLTALAEQRGVDLGDATKKADIIAAIELHAETNS